MDEEVMGREMREELPSEDSMVMLADFFKMFSDSTRIRILFAIENEAKCVSEISGQLGMTPSCVSHQLKILRSANLIKSERRGKNVYYTLVDCHVGDIIDKALEHIEE